MRNFSDWTPSPGTVLRVVLLVVAATVIAIASYWLGNNINQLLPLEATAEAQAVDDLFRFELTVASIIVLSIGAAMLYSAIAFRRRPGDFSDGPPIHESLPVEILWTLIPIVLVAFLSVYSYNVYLRLTRNADIQPIGHLHPNNDSVAYAQDLPTSAPAQPATRDGLPPIEIGVEAQQWAWVFTYPGKISTAELHVPFGREVRLRMTSPDVIHAFWVAEFRLQQYVLPGRETLLRLLVRTPGKYVLQCSMICGTYHGAMRADVFVDSPENYQRWLTSQQKSAARPANQPILLGNRETTTFVSHLTPARGK